MLTCISPGDSLFYPDYCYMRPHLDLGRWSVVHLDDDSDAFRWLASSPVVIGHFDRCIRRDAQRY
jgi:hypothetical protein